MCHLLTMLYINKDKRMLTFIKKYPNEKSINTIGKRFDDRYVFKLIKLERFHLHHLGKNISQNSK